MRGSSWIVGVVAALGLVSYMAVAQDPLDKKPTQRDLDSRVRNLESFLIEQDGRIRDLTRDMADMKERIGSGIIPGPDTKGKFDGIVKITSVSTDYDFIQLDNGFGLEVADESKDDANNSLTGAKVDLYFNGKMPFPYRAICSRDANRSPIFLKVRLVGKP